MRRKLYVLLMILMTLPALVRCTHFGGAGKSGMATVSVQVKVLK